MSKYSLIQDDILNWAATYTGEPYHAIFCDPPYHLVSISKRFGQPNSKPAKGDVYRRSSAGFMGMLWDSVDESGNGIAFNPETWAALGEHLYPGGFGMAFASSRGWHRLAVAIEDAGFIIHPSIFGWCFLSGFPKATRIDTQVDKAAGVEREVIASDRPQFGMNKTRVEQGYRPNLVKNGNITTATTKLAQTWEGHRYGLQAMKPALEPIILFQKPYTGRPVDCITQTGAGAWNIDGGRISGQPEATRFDPSRHSHEGLRMDATGSECADRAEEANGRWPANLILDEEGARLLDEQSGIRPAGSSRTGNEPSDKTKNTYDGGWGPAGFEGYGDSGGASRMFFQSDWQYEILEQLEAADPLRYEPKVSTAEREAGLDELPERLRHRVNAGGLENEPRFAPVKLKNHHPTLKPISLTKYLATLLLPPDAYAPRRILIPFAGTGSEMIGAMFAGWDEVTGIEKSEEYTTIAEARLAWWSQWPKWGQTDVDKILATVSAKEDKSQAIQMEMF